MSRSLVSAAVLLLVAAAVGQGAIGGAVAQAATLEITIVDSDGDPVSDIEVSVTWDGGDGGPRTDTTRANGKVLFDVPEGSNVEITVDDDRYIRNSPYVLFNAGNQDVEVGVSRSGTATVTVVDGSGPVAGAEVRLSGDGGSVGQYTTDGDGEIATGRLERRTYDLRVSKPGYSTNETAINISGDVSQTVRLRRATVEAQFTVTDDHFDPPEPLENATVRIPQLGTTLSTLSDGTRSTNVPVNREYDVTITKEGWETTTTTLTVGESSVSHEASIQRIPALEVTSANDRVVVGESTTVTVTDEYDQRVEGASVSVDGETVGTTNSQGQLSVTIDRAGDVPVEVTRGDASASFTVEGVEGSQATPTATGTSTPTATDTPTGEPTETATPTPTETPGDGGPGFGVVAAALAVLGAGLLGRRR